MPTFDNHSNLSYSTVAFPPTFAGSGITLGVAPGTGANYPAAPFNCTVWPRGAIPLKGNAEIIRVTAVNGDIFTILRAQEGTTQQLISVGYQIANTATAKTFTDLEAYISGYLTDPGSNGIVKRTALGTTAPAAAGTDYQAPLTFSTGLLNSANTITAPAQDTALLIANALGAALIAETTSVNVSSQTGLVIANQTLYLESIWLPSAQTLTGVKWFQQFVGNYTGNNFNGVALFTYSAGTLTQVAVSNNNPACWATGGNSSYGSQAFSGQYAAAPGLYFIGVLYSQSAQTTAPHLSSSSGIISGAENIGTNSSFLWAQLPSQTSMPTSIACSSCTPVTNPLWLALY